MKHVRWKPAVLALGILVVITASGILLRGNTGSDQKPLVSKGDEQSTRAGGTVRANESAEAAAKGGASPTRADERHQLLETVGVLTAAHCYQTYFNLGL